MHHTLSSALSALVFLSISSCQSAPAPLTAADIDAQRALSESFRDRVLAKDWDAVSQMYADSAIFMPPNSPAIRGRAAIREWLGAFPPVATFTVIDDGVVGAGDLVYTYGRYTMTLGLAGSPVDSGKYLDIRRKQKDGSWKYEADMFNTSVPLPATP